MSKAKRILTSAIRSGKGPQSAKEFRQRAFGRFSKAVITIMKPGGKKIVAKAL